MYSWPVLRLYVICVALTAGACRDNELAKLTKTRDEVCACKTVKCAEAALDHVPKSNVEPSPRAQRIAREMLDCLAALYDAGRPTQDPDAPDPAPAP
jgi:hypothetical protein